MQRLLLILLALISVNSFADANDTKVISDFLSNFVYELDQPVYVYNWFNSYGHDKIWQTKLSATSSAGYDHVLSGTVKYWQSFCSKNPALNPPDCPKTLPTSDNNNNNYGGGNMYGPGLYLAVDPVATNEYGGGSSWVLMQLHFPKGLRIMDIRRDGSMNFPLKVQRALISLGCPKEWLTSANYSSSLGTFFNMNAAYTQQGIQTGYNQATGQMIYAPVSDQCLVSIRKVLKDDLKIEAFYYSYNGEEFKECDLPDGQSSGYNQNGSNNVNRQGAFVLVDPKRMKPDDVRVFNSQTRDDVEDRLRIQSLFYKAEFDSPEIASRSFYSKQSYPNNPGYNFSGTNNNCNWDSATQKTICKVQITLCPQAGGTCLYIDPPMPAPAPVMQTVISKTHVPASQSYNTESLLWDDLDSKAIPGDMGQWVLDNLFGCKVDPEYE